MESINTLISYATHCQSTVELNAVQIWFFFSFPIAIGLWWPSQNGKGNASVNLKRP